MKLRRFKIDKECIEGWTATIKDPGEIRHIGKVLRLKAGDEVILFDGEGKEYHALLTRLSPREISLTLLREPSSVAAESPLKIILGVGLLKSSKFDWLIQKTTELGVAEVVPFYSLHVVPRWEEAPPRRGRGNPAGRRLLPRRPSNAAGPRSPKFILPALSKKCWP